MTLVDVPPEVPVSAALRVALAGRDYTLGDGDIVIAAITSCTNTSNPANLITAGLLARNAAARAEAQHGWPADHHHGERE